MEISNRLQMLIDLVPRVNTVADIGCDHGYVPIALIQSGKIKHAIAMDINVGPLERARQNVILHGLKNQIDLRLSDGFEKLRIGEVDCAILAGMGGKLVLSILTKEIDKTKQIPTLILQPQSDISEVRKAFPNLGYSCCDERILCEEHKYYFMMIATKNEETKQVYNELELRFGKYLLERKDPILFQFIQQKKNEYLKIEQTLSSQKELKNNQKKRMKEIHIEMQYILDALKYYDEENNYE